jgi:hypothetical protein
MATLNIFPTSPVPADFSRSQFWNESAQTFDSGAFQGSTPYIKPLYKYVINLTNIPRSKQSSLHYFVNNQKNGTIPFLFEDPYDCFINGVVCVNTGTQARSFFVVTPQGYPYIPVSGSLRMTSALSGVLTQGTHFQFDMATGIFSTWVAPATNDFWTASCQYFRKCVIDAYQESSKNWNQFGGSISFHEIAIP